jgi:formyltetrahydrofolate hydrolase
MLAGKKTYITAAVAIIGAIAGYLTGDLDLGAAVQLAVTAILGATLRNGIG